MLQDRTKPLVDCPVVREEKNLKLCLYEGSEPLNIYKHNVFSPAMTFSEDGSLFAYCDGTR